MSKSSLVKKFGQDFNCHYRTLKGEDKKVNFYFPKPIKEPMNFKIGSQDFKDPLYAGL